MRTAFRAFHGTVASRVDSIRTAGFHPSDNPDDWLGEGTYFFVEGLDDPWTSAAQWARTKAYDKADHEFDEQVVAVIEASIEVDDDAVFDLREPENARRFHVARREWLRDRVPRRSTHLPRPAERTYDTDLLDLFKQEQGVAVLIGDFHIQMSLRERHFRLDSRIPNVSVLCLSDPAPTAVVSICDIRTITQSSHLETKESRR